MRPPKALSIALFLSLVGLMPAVSNSILNKRVRANVQDNQQQEEKLPGGTWSMATIFDSRQVNDTTVPAEITRTTTSIDKGKDSGLEELVILNRTWQAITAIKLSYIVSRPEDLETVLSRGALEIISKKAIEKQRIPGNQRRIFKVLNGWPGKMLKPLVKEGKLSGAYIVRIRINEITFEDGSTWSG